MNLPSYLLRLYVSLVDDTAPMSDEYISTIALIEEISQVMYFAQFALNALYLICIIYNATKRRFTVRDDQNISDKINRSMIYKDSDRNNREISLLYGIRTIPKTTWPSLKQSWFTSSWANREWLIQMDQAFLEEQFNKQLTNNTTLNFGFANIQI